MFCWMSWLLKEENQVLHGDPERVVDPAYVALVNLNGREDLLDTVGDQIHDVFLVQYYLNY